MIFIDRSRVKAPRILVSATVRVEKSRAQKFFTQKSVLSKQSRFHFKARAWTDRTVRKALERLFHGKCAYCETRLSSQGDVDHFRPASGAVGLDGDFSPQHYYWTAFEWRNLYLACEHCNRHKRNLFPVFGGRATPETAYEDLLLECAVLIDPCNENPAPVLVFTEEGTIASEDERGRMSIELLRLNREQLVKTRGDAFTQLKKRYAVWQSSQDQAQLAELLKEAAPQSEFCGMKRQFLHRWGVQLPEEISEELQSMSWILEGMEKAQADISEEQQEATAAKYKEYAISLEDYDLEEESEKRKFILLDQTLERVEVEKLRVMEKISFQIAPGDAERAPWVMILGENGCGKSSLLQSIALTLIGDQLRSEQPIEAASYVRWGEERAVVRLSIAGLSHPLELTFGMDGSMSGSATRPKVPILAYGSTRFLPRTGVTVSRGTRYARVGNLFNPLTALSDATSWMLSLDEERFHSVARTLREILTLPDETVLEPNQEDGRIEIPWLGAHSLSELSDGYQSVVAMCVDIMKVMLEHFGAMEAAKGIVLVDELGAHLHPRWRMRIVERLRSAFPHVQFIVTTHDPLCLRGLKDGEVVVLKKNSRGEVYVLPDPPSVAGMRVDQLLTSEHFGLSSTVDPELEESFERYYSLLSKKKLTQEQREELDSLRGLLERHRVLGATRRERIMLLAIDRHLARASRAARSSEGRARERAMLDDRLLELLDRIESLPEPGEAKKSKKGKGAKKGRKAGETEA